MMTEYIPEWVIALAFLLSAYTFVRRGQWEHALTRFFIVIFYTALAMYPGVPMDIGRPLSRWLLFLLGSIEVLSYVMRRIAGRRNPQ
jgi:hypothetical protein